jgi:hypothetical protein
MSLHGTLDATVDGDVTFRFEVTNEGSSPAELNFRSGRQADVAVTDVDSGDEVWRWSAGRMFTQALTSEQLAPGETLVQTYTWSDPPAGTYEAEATLAARQDAPATVTVTV